MGQAANAVGRLLETSVERVEPSRRKRGLAAESFRCWLKDGRSVIATCRATATRTAFEAHVLRQLAAHGAEVPKVYAAEGDWLIQEDLGSLRLSKAILERESDAVLELLSDGIESLHRVHRAGRAAGLDHDAPEPIRFEQVLEWARALATRTSTKLPGLNVDALRAAFEELAADAFIKSDARPARALIRNEHVVWFDWARCARGRRMQDLIGLLGDEALPDWPDLEDTLLDRHLPQFITSLDRGRAFFAVYGTLHLTRRMGAILELRHESGGWWPLEECLDADHPIVTAEAYERLRVRAERWAKTSVLTAPLVRWLRELQPYLIDGFADTLRRD